jgi:Bacterial Ig domain/Glycosyl hydrolase family 26
MRRPLKRALTFAAFLVLSVLGVTGASAAVDRQADGPAIVFASPIASATVGGVVTVTGTATAPAGVSRVELRVDELDYQAATGTGIWSFKLDTFAFANGPHNLKARVTDAAGAQAWADLPILISNAASQAAPRVAFTSPGANGKAKNILTVNGTASSAVGLTRVDVQVDDSPFQRAAGLGRWTAKVDTTEYLDGTHHLTARVTDAEGQTKTTIRPIVIANHPNQIYWGAVVSGKLYGFHDPPWDMRSLYAFEKHAGKKVAILALGANWGSGKASVFPTAQMERIRRHGSIPLYSWASMGRGNVLASDPSTSADQPKYSLSRIINGSFDPYIRKWALAAKAWGHPFFLRFDWEMNLQNWFPWIETVNGNSRGQFVKMWRHVHDIFTSVGATNVTWVWCPNAEYSRSIKPLSSLYPGNQYVDWTCIDGYNWGLNPWRRNIWQPFSDVIGPTYRNILGTVAPSKPVMIGETGSSEFGGSKAAWITDFLDVQLPHHFRHVKAFIWFNEHDKADWEIETSPAATKAFRAAIRRPYFATAQFGSLRALKLTATP